MRRVVVKIGGSLLTLPDLSDRLRRLFEGIPADRILLLVGGGSAANLVRDWDGIHGLDPEVSHWLAIDSLSLTARLLATLLPEAMLVSDYRSAHDASLSIRVAILDPIPVLNELSSESGSVLPVGWDCTSDSIAGWIATRWKVDSLILAKSVDAPFDEASACAAVDHCFDAVVAEQLPVYWCNVRTRSDHLVLWKAGEPTGRLSSDACFE